jgi:ABC-2 type transport system ATP-binding protein
VPQEINFNLFETPGDDRRQPGGLLRHPAPLARERAEKYLTQLSLWDRSAAWRGRCPAA